MNNLSLWKAPTLHRKPQSRNRADYRSLLSVSFCVISRALC
jgi:hypothetical protein